MATSVTGSNQVALTEHALMEDALDRVLPPGSDPVCVATLVAALRNSNRYGVYFQKVNARGLHNTLSRWLRTNAFRNHALVSGVGIRNVSDRPEQKTMQLDFNLPKRMADKLGKF